MSVITSAWQQLPVPVVAALLVLVLLLLLSVTAWWRATTRQSRRNRARQRVARAAETEAEHLLEQLGYRILERQPAQHWQLTVDDQPAQVVSRADLLVERHGLLWVADVKSGALAPDPRRPATRRQLLEYLLAFDADGALVVDMSRGQVRTVAFPDLLP